jgi:glycosyltransferase involved in cell wall biosynthesis
MVVKNKKIIQIVCTYPPYKGGTGAVAYNFKKYLKELFDIDSLLLTPKYKKDYFSEEKDVIFIKPWVKTGNAAFIPGIYKYLKEADVVIFHTPFFGAVEPLLWKLKFSKKKPKILVYYHQDPLIDKGLRKYVFNFYNKFIYPALFKRADRVLGSSVDYLKNSLLTPAYEKMPEKFRGVPLGVDTKRFYPVQDGNLLNKVREKYNLPADKALITFVGGLGQSHYFKGIKFLIEAAKKLKDQNIDFGKVVLVGRGNLIEEYNAYAEKLGVADKIAILTTVEDDELNVIYNLSTVNVLPSMDTSSEVFGLVSVEAMAVKTPVITSNIVGVRTVTENGKTGFLIESGNVDELTDRLKRLLTNPELAKQMGEAAYKRVNELFTWEKTVENLKNIIEETCNE